jgi:hypothetical protein
MNRHPLIVALFCLSIIASGFCFGTVAVAAPGRSPADSLAQPEASSARPADTATMLAVFATQTTKVDMLLAQKIVKQSSKSGKSVKQTIANQLKTPKKQKVSPSKAKQQKIV